MVPIPDFVDIGLTFFSLAFCCGPDLLLSCGPGGEGDRRVLDAPAAAIISTRCREKGNFLSAATYTSIPPLKFQHSFHSLPMNFKVLFLLVILGLTSAKKSKGSVDSDDEFVFIDRFCFTANADERGSLTVKQFC